MRPLASELRHAEPVYLPATRRGGVLIRTRSGGCRMRPITGRQIGNLGQELMKTIAIAALALLLSRPAAAQEVPRWEVWVEHTGEDRVGALLAFALREEVRRSAGYKPALRASESLFQLRLVSLDLAVLPTDPKGVASAISVVLTMANLVAMANLAPDDIQVVTSLFLGTQLWKVGADRVDGEARAIMAFLDSAAERAVALMRNAAAR